MRSKWFRLFGIILALMLVTGILAGNALAATAGGDAHARHDMSATDSSDQHSGHDMNNMEGMNMDEMSQESSGGHAGHGDSSGDHDSSSGSHNYTSNGGHDSGSGGHGGGAQDPNTPPNWPVIYGFGAFNLLVIIAAALMKNKGLSGVN